MFHVFLLALLKPQMLCTKCCTQELLLRIHKSFSDLKKIITFCFKLLLPKTFVEKFAEKGTNRKYTTYFVDLQKQPSIGVLIIRCFATLLKFHFGMGVLV